MPLLDLSTDELVVMLGLQRDVHMVARVAQTCHALRTAAARVMTDQLHLDASEMAIFSQAAIGDVDANTLLNGSTSYSLRTALMLKMRDRAADGAPLLSRITLENVMCHDGVTMDLHPSVTSIIGSVGVGKTAVLQAVSFALGHSAVSPRYVLWTSRLLRVGASSGRIRLWLHVPVPFTASGRVPMLLECDVRDSTSVLHARGNTTLNGIRVQEDVLRWLRALLCLHDDVGHGKEMMITLLKPLQLEPDRTLLGQYEGDTSGWQAFERIAHLSELPTASVPCRVAHIQSVG